MSQFLGSHSGRVGRFMIRTNDSCSAGLCDVAGLERIGASARGPVLHLFLSALVWLMFGSALALAASVKLHDPEFLAENAWLTFGRVRPAHMNSMIYGWATMGSSGVAVWLMARLCRSPL